LKNLYSSKINKTYIIIKLALDKIVPIAQVIFPKSEEKSIFFKSFCLIADSSILNLVR
jgi:hypothetical protein